MRVNEKMKPLTVYLVPRLIAALQRAARRESARAGRRVSVGAVARRAIQAASRRVK